MLVSVKMITYNHESFIGKAIEGVLMQKTDFDFELIICSDCSTDKTDDVISEYLQTHGRKNLIKYFRHEKNLGAYRNGIFALNQCKGKYIALCEGDDYWTDPLKLQKQVDLMENGEDVGLVYTNFAYLIGSQKSEHNFEFANFFSLNDFFVNNIPFLFTGSWLINRKYIEHLQFIVKYPNLPGDAQFAVEILSKGAKIVHLNEQTGVYRVLAESESHSKKVDKDIGFLQLKYALMKKYEKQISPETKKTFIENLVRKQFHNFTCLGLNFSERLELLTVAFKLKGFERSFKYLLFNKT